MHIRINLVLFGLIFACSADEGNSCIGPLCNDNDWENTDDGFIGTGGLIDISDDGSSLLSESLNGGIGSSRENTEDSTNIDVNNTEDSTNVDVNNTEDSTNVDVNNTEDSTNANVNNTEDSTNVDFRNSGNGSGVGSDGFDVSFLGNLTNMHIRINLVSFGLIYVCSADEGNSCIGPLCNDNDWENTDDGFIGTGGLIDISDDGSSLSSESLNGGTGSSRENNTEDRTNVDVNNTEDSTNVDVNNTEDSTNVDVRNSGNGSDVGPDGFGVSFLGAESNKLENEVQHVQQPVQNVSGLHDSSEVEGSLITDISVLNRETTNAPPPKVVVLNRVSEAVTETVNRGDVAMTTDGVTNNLVPRVVTRPGRQSADRVVATTNNLGTANDLGVSFLGVSVNGFGNINELNGNRVEGNTNGRSVAVGPRSDSGTGPLVKETGANVSGGTGNNGGEWGTRGISLGSSNIAIDGHVLSFWGPNGNGVGLEKMNNDGRRTTGRERRIGRGFEIASGNRAGSGFGRNVASRPPVPHAVVDTPPLRTPVSRYQPSRFRRIHFGPSPHINSFASAAQEASITSGEFGKPGVEVGSFRESSAINPGYALVRGTDFGINTPPRNRPFPANIIGNNNWFKLGSGNFGFSFRSYKKPYFGSQLMGKMKAIGYGYETKMNEGIYSGFTSAFDLSRKYPVGPVARVRSGFTTPMYQGNLIRTVARAPMYMTSGYTRGIWDNDKIDEVLRASVSYLDGLTSRSSHTGDNIGIRRNVNTWFTKSLPTDIMGPLKPEKKRGFKRDLSFDKGGKYGKYAGVGGYVGGKYAEVGWYSGIGSKGCHCRKRCFLTERPGGMCKFCKKCKLVRCCRINSKKY